MKAKQLKNGKIKLSMNSFEVSKEFCDELGITIREYKERKGGSVKQPTLRELILDISKDVSELKSDMKKIKNLPTIKKELSKS